MSLPTITVVALSALNGGEKTVKLICVGCLATRFNHCKLLANLGIHKYRMFIQRMCVLCVHCTVQCASGHPGITLMVASA